MRECGTAKLADVYVPLANRAIDAPGQGRCFGRRAGLKPRSAGVSVAKAGNGLRGGIARELPV